MDNNIKAQALSDDDLDIVSGGADTDPDPGEMSDLNSEWLQQVATRFGQNYITIYISNYTGPNPQKNARAAVRRELSKTPAGKLLLTLIPQ